MLETPYPRLVKTLRNGKIPLISIDRKDGATEEYVLNVHSRSRSSTSVAISHVWADGLGNPCANALPTCQILYLKRKLSRLWDIWNSYRDIPQSRKRPMLFWMDTLCIPTTEKDRSLRTMQINKMASIYKGSLCVLVLDRELMSSKMGDEFRTHDAGKPYPSRTEEGPRELDLDSRARVACSFWMSRSWTLQEGHLPRLIAIQFSDEVCIFGWLWYSTGVFDPAIPNDFMDDTSFSPPVPNPPPETCICVSIALKKAFLLMFCDKKSMTFPKIWNELAGRSTTKSEDVPFIITNLLDRENTELLRYHEPGRMLQTILLSLSRVPLPFSSSLDRSLTPLATTKTGGSFKMFAVKAVLNHNLA